MNGDFLGNQRRMNTRVVYVDTEHGTDDDGGGDGRRFGSRRRRDREWKIELKAMTKKKNSRRNKKRTYEKYGFRNNSSQCMRGKLIASVLPHRARRSPSLRPLTVHNAKRS